MIPTVKKKKTEVLLEAIGRCLNSKATPAGSGGQQSLPELDHGKDEGEDE